TANVAPGSRRQDHTISPYAADVSSGERTRLTPQRPSQPAPRSRDDRANVPRGGAGWKVDTANQNSGKEKYFRYWGLTGFRQTEVICPSGKPGSATPPIFVIVWRRGNTGLAKT